MCVVQQPVFFNVLYLHKRLWEVHFLVTQALIHFVWHHFNVVRIVFSYVAFLVMFISLLWVTMLGTKIVWYGDTILKLVAYAGHSIPNSEICFCDLLHIHFSFTCLLVSVKFQCHDSWVMPFCEHASLDFLLNLCTISFLNYVPKMTGAMLHETQFD